MTLEDLMTDYGFEPSDNGWSSISLGRIELFVRAPTGTEWERAQHEFEDCEDSRPFYCTWKAWSNRLNAWLGDPVTEPCKLTASRIESWK